MSKKIIISRTDGIGDVVLTLPVAGLLKQLKPDYKIYFLGRSYTKPVIEACEHIDEFLDWDEILNWSSKKKIEYFQSLDCDTIIHVFPDEYLAKITNQSKIPNRIGTSHRVYHWLYCNELIKLGRLNSNLHEAQLNLKLLSQFGAKETYQLNEIIPLYGFTKIKELNSDLKSLIDPAKFNLILHPKSKGSAREWGLDNYEKLIEILPSEKFKIFISGTAQDKKYLNQFLEKVKSKVTDITDQMSLSTFISFINSADGIVAASTGPLHIAAALGKVAIGLFAPMRPIHPGRWSPVGTNSSFLVLDKECSKCVNSTTCECIQSISPNVVLLQLEKSLISVQS
jgi:heptosyltransferase-3